jgi:AraC-like DNA-binding protein
LFLPVEVRGALQGILVAGPVAIARPSSADILARWFSLTNTHGRLTDPSFSEYLSATLFTLTLEGRLFAAFERLLTCFAKLVTGQGSPEALGTEIDGLREQLLLTRAPERAWSAVRSMVNQRTTRSWVDSSAFVSLVQVGLTRRPQHVAVGLLLARETGLDPVEELLRRDAFQRACVGLARKHGEVVSGQAQSHGVTFLLNSRAVGPRARAELLALVTSAAALARRFGFRLHAGITLGTGRDSLPEAYRVALAAAEKALSQGVGLLDGETRPALSAEELRELRMQLGESIGQRLHLLRPRFDRYVEAVLAHYGYGFEATQAHLEAGLQRLADPLLANGSLDRKSFSELCAGMELGSRDATTTMELVQSYRRLVSDLETALDSPTGARQERSLRRALEFIREHLSEPLPLSRVARVAGFAPGYFSKLFKREEGVTFERYTLGLRIERAKQMLLGTRLSVGQVQELSGFRTRTHFHRVFKQAVGTPPHGYRELEQ